MHRLIIMHSKLTIVVVSINSSSFGNMVLSLKLIAIILPVVTTGYLLFFFKNYLLALKSVK